MEHAGHRERRRTPCSRSCIVHRGESPHDDLQEEGMIKVSVMYPNKPGVRFDHEYYRTKHLPLIKSRMGAALKYYTIDKGLADREGRPLTSLCRHVPPAV